MDKSLRPVSVRRRLRKSVAAPLATLARARQRRTRRRRPTFGSPRFTSFRAGPRSSDPAGQHDSCQTPAGPTALADPCWPCCRVSCAAGQAGLCRSGGPSCTGESAGSRRLPAGSCSPCAHQGGRDAGSSGRHPRSWASAKGSPTAPSVRHLPRLNPRSAGGWNGPSRGAQLRGAPLLTTPPDGSTSGTVVPLERGRPSTRCVRPRSEETYSTAELSASRPCI
jgi:hypothetical protein